MDGIEKTAKLLLSTQTETPLQREFTNVGQLNYRVDSPDTPGCLKIFYGRKTVIVPLRNLLLVEFDL